MKFEEAIVAYREGEKKTVCMECGQSNGFHQPGCQWHRDDRINDSVCYNNMAKRIEELTAERDEARALVKMAKCCVFIGEIDEAVRRWDKS